MSSEIKIDEPPLGPEVSDEEVVERMEERLAKPTLEEMKEEIARQFQESLRKSIGVSRRFFISKPVEYITISLNVEPSASPDVQEPDGTDRKDG